MTTKIRLLVPAASLALTLAATAQEGWWMREPIRWIQTNIRETDSATDPKKLVDDLASFRANVLLLNMGGIVSQYRTKIEFHTISPHMPPGRDLFGEVLREAHRRGIRVVGRFDFSKTARNAFDARPEWFFRMKNGEPVVYNELYSTCINGGYYRDHAMKILTEALDGYEVDGLFFNMFGNQSADYSGRFVGHCHCESCRTKYRAMYGRDLPAEPDAQYREFMYASSREVAAEIGKLIRAKRPQAGYFNYIQQFTDGIMSESNTAVRRPLPLWPYTSSDNVNRARNSEPGKMSVNLCMQFMDYPWRFATVPPREISLRLWQNVAHGGALAFAINGTFEQQDRQALEAAKPVFLWLADHERYYVKQESAARVLLLGSPQRSGRVFNRNAYRGLFRLLTEEHIPFAVSDNMSWLGKRAFDLVLAADWAPAELSGYLQSGGKVIVVSPEKPEFYDGRVVERHKNVEGYMRVRDKKLFPSLRSVDLLMLNGEYTETEPHGAAALTFVPRSMYGPPEKIHVDIRDTDKPGVVMGKLGKGEFAWIPWDVGGMYYLHSLPGHAGVLRDLADRMLGAAGRQIHTNAHALVEMVWMKQGERRLLHLVNLSGHSDTAYFDPVPMSGIRMDVEGEFAKVRALRAAQDLVASRRGGRTEFTVPALGEYELVVLEK